MNEKLRVVLDTNILISSLSRRLPTYKIILDKLFAGDYEAFVTTEILLEYEEKLAEFFDREVAETIVGGLALLENVHKTDLYFRFNLISQDEDDNKFVDVALASNAHYLVTNDKDFQHLKNLDYPKIELLTIDEFKFVLENLKLKPQ
jgi:putative PIN family toxin of toxin-antitoxin system